jgi:hypothetical protein
MRNRTQERIEVLASERDLGTIDLAVVEEGIEFGRRQMAEMIRSYQAEPAKAREAVLSPAARGAGAPAPAPARAPEDLPPPLNEAQPFPGMGPRGAPPRAPDPA